MVQRLLLADAGVAIRIRDVNSSQSRALVFVQVVVEDLIRKLFQLMLLAVANSGDVEVAEVPV
jgi:hypothetical protein